MVKNLKRTLLVLMVIAFAVVLKSTTVCAATTSPDSASEAYEVLISTDFSSNYNIYLGEKSYIVDYSTYYYLSSEGTFSITSSNTDVCSVSKYTLTGVKVGSANITINATYNDNSYTKTFKVTVKKTSVSMSLDSSTNDVVSIVSSSDTKNEVLLANSELWTLDNSTFKLSKKSTGNISSYLSGYVYDSGTDIRAKLTTANRLSFTNGNNTKVVSSVSEVSKFGFLRKNGDYYMFTYSDSKVSYKKVASDVTTLVGDYLYVKNGKTYSIAGKQIFSFAVSEIAGSSTAASGLAMTSKGVVYSYTYKSSTDSYTTTKVATGASSLITNYSYKDSSGNVQYVGTVTESLVKSISVASTTIQKSYNYIKLWADGNLYLNDQKILTKVATISSIKSGEAILIVRTDGSIWTLKLSGNASLRKVRSGKTSAKRLSAPTNVKATKSGSSNVKVSWTKVSGATKYAVYRSTSKDGTYSKIGTTTSGSYTDKTSKIAQTYYYKVVAICSTSAYNSSKSSVAVIRIPKAPTSLKVSKQSSTSMKVSYKKSTGITGYEIVYSTSKDFTNSKTVTTTSTSKTIKSLTKNKTYYVKVRAYKTIAGKKVYSSYTKVVKVSLK